MYMDDGEIVRDSLQAKDRKAQVGILADLNLTTRSHVLDILAKHGLDARRKKLEDHELMSLYKDGLNDSQIAKTLGVSATAIKHWRIKNGLDGNWKHGKKVSKKNESLLMDLWEAGKNDCQIAKIIGCTPSAICQWRKRNGLARNCGRGRKY